MTFSDFLSLNVKRKLEINILILSEITDLFFKSFFEASKSLIKGISPTGMSGSISLISVLCCAPYCP